METATEILIVIVSTVLSIFLIVGIVALILIIKILKHVRRIAERAETVAEKAEAVGSFFQKAAGPLAVSRILTQLVKVFRSKDPKSKGGTN